MVSGLSQTGKGEAMFSTGTPVGTIQPYFLTQAVPDLDRHQPLEQQPELAGSGSDDGSSFDFAP